MQNIIILIIVSICAFFIGRRLYRNLRNQGSDCGCGSSCSACSSGSSSSCNVSDQK